MPQQSRPKVLLISDLSPCPVSANLVTEHMIESIRSSLEGGRAVPGITVALLDGSKYYIVDGHARVEAHKRAELEEVSISEVLDLESESEVMIEHVRHNLHGSLNPIKVAAIAGLLAKSGIHDPFRRLGLSPVMSTAANVVNRWPADVRSKLSEVIQACASKFSDVYALPHFFAAFEEMTDKLYQDDTDTKEQLRSVTSHIVRYLESIKEESEFALPSPDQVRMIMSVRRQRIVETAQAGGRQSGGHINNEGGRMASANRTGYRQQQPLILPDRNKSMIECTHCGRSQVVDLKTGHACHVESVAGDMIDVIREDGGRRSYALSIKAMEFLGLDRPAEEISPARYAVMATDKKSEVEQAIKSAKPTARFVVIISDYLL